MRLLAFVSLSLGLLNVSPDVAEKVVEYLQDRIFVESRFLVVDEPDQSGKICDSVSGPHCKLRSPTMSGPIPLGFLASGSISLNDIIAFVPQVTWDFDVHAIAPGDTQPYASLNLAQSQAVGQPVQSHYSLGLPEGVIAEWDSHWLVDKYSRAGSTSFLPGYIRFSKPVMIRKLWIELSHPDSKIIVILRRGSLVVWRSAVLENSDQAVDACLSGADGATPLEPVDEIAVVSNAKGFSISSIELFQSTGQLVPVMLLIPLSPELVSIKAAMVDSSLIDLGVVVSMSQVIKNNQHLLRGGFETPNNLIVTGELVIPEELRLILKKDQMKRLRDRMRGVVKKTMSEAEAKELGLVDDLYLAILLHH